MLFWILAGAIVFAAMTVSESTDAVATPASAQGSEAAPADHSCNTPEDRSCWLPGFDINTDSDNTHPNTGKTRVYTFNLTEKDDWIGPDGQVKRKAMLVNGQFPGPTIFANWGDTVNVTVYNGLRSNGTSMHWHGVRMLNNNINDGVPGITECPLAPEKTKTYSFVASQYGTSWYHSHYSSQYANGIVGPVVIYGPASAPYDIDLGAFLISDWYYDDAESLLARVSNPQHPFDAGQPGSPPPSDNVLLNGSHVAPGGGGGGRYGEVALMPGRRHRLRLINASVDNTFTVTLAGHNMTVIQTDFVPVEPRPAAHLYLTIGQRYDVVLEASASAPAASYWLNLTASASGACGRSRAERPAAVVRYDGAPAGLPREPGEAPPDSFCEDGDGFAPVVRRRAPETSFQVGESNTLPVGMVVDAGSNRVFWAVNGSSLDISWDTPTLVDILQGNETWRQRQNVIILPKSDEWSYWLIQNQSPVPHPMHLHGHDFVILGRSKALQDPLGKDNSTLRTFNASVDSAALNWGNPTRRDSTVLPALGWLVVAFRPDNPGSWVFHCHIAWHISQGFSVQFLEMTSDIQQWMDLSQVADTCTLWKSFVGASGDFQQGSGI